MKSTNVRRHRSTVFAIAALGLSLFASARTRADAVGGQTWGEVSIPTPSGSFVIPAGLLDHSILGQGNNISYQQAEFLSVGPISNWRIDWINLDLNGQEVNRSPGQIQQVSGRYGQRISDFRPGSVPVAMGWACAALIVMDQEIVRQCHAITP